MHYNVGKDPAGIQSRCVYMFNTCVPNVQRTIEQSYLLHCWARCHFLQSVRQLWYVTVISLIVTAPVRYFSLHYLQVLTEIIRSLAVF